MGASSFGVFGGAGGLAVWVWWCGFSESGFMVRVWGCGFGRCGFGGVDLAVWSLAVRGGGYGVLAGRVLGKSAGGALDREQMGRRAGRGRFSGRGRDESRRGGSVREALWPGGGMPRWRILDRDGGTSERRMGKWPVRDASGEYGKMPRGWSSEWDGGREMAGPGCVGDVWKDVVGIDFGVGGMGRERRPERPVRDVPVRRNDDDNGPRARKTAAYGINSKNLYYLCLLCP